MELTRLSEKGQIVIPKRLRDSRGWKAGLAFAIEEHGEGIILRPMVPVVPTKIEDVLGCVRYKGATVTLDQMDAAIAAAAKNRDDCC